MNIEKFNERLIAFDFKNEMVNANDLAKQYNKKPNDFLRLESTQAFIDAFKSDAVSNGITNFEPVITIKGNFSTGKSQGTWMHRILAYKFAAWLDPKIEVFVYRTFDAVATEAKKISDQKLLEQQRQLDYFWDKEDRNDTYGPYDR